jgi:hypothetical protein
MVVTLTFAACYEKYLSHGYSPEIAQLMANEETARLTGYKRN